MTMTLGVAHVAGTYHIVNGDGTFTDDGLAFIHDTLGVNCCELWLGPSYATYFGGDVFAPAGPANLTALASATPLSTALANADFHTYFLKAFTWNDAGIDAWKFSTTNRQTYLAAEYTEIYDLATHLLTTYAGTGKRFVLQTSESDWPLLDGVPGTFVDPERTIWLAAWYRTRQNAINQARKDTAANDVYVEGAIELNRIYECFQNYDANLITTKVLDKVQPDRVSLSAYQLINDPLGPPWWWADQATMLAAVRSGLNQAFEWIRRYTDAPIYIGEGGYPENEYPAGYDIATCVNNMIDVCDDDGDITHFVYWQVWNNELVGGAPRGYWCQDDAGNITATGTQIQTMQVGRP